MPKGKTKAGGILEQKVDVIASDKAVDVQEAQIEEAGSKNAKLPRRSFVSDMPDRGLFAIVSLVGFGLIVLLKLNGISSELVAVLATCLMLGYGWLAYRVPAVHLRLDRLGDNFYYLGFILTLASMSAALIQLRDGIEMSVILGNFGVALITTIVGIAGRVVFVQMRSEIDHIETAIRHDLLAKNTELKGQIQASIREFEVFRIAARQATEEQHKKDLELVGALARNYTSELEKVIQAATDNLQKSLSAQSSVALRMNEAVQDLVATTDQLRKRLSSFNSPLGGLHKILSEFNQDLWPLLKSTLANIERTHKQKRRWFRWTRR